jgi:hypothetical protein
MISKQWHKIKSFIKAFMLVFGKNKKAVCMPTTFEEAVSGMTHIISVMREEDKDYLINQKTAELFAASLHHNIGRSIRNNWMLWDKTSPLVRHFEIRYGVTHADDISGIVIMCTWQFLNSQPMTPEKYAKSCIDYWKKISKIESFND